MKDALLIILGAGISYHFGLPLWDDLVSSLYSDHKDNPSLPSGSYSNEKLAEYFRSKYYKNDDSRYPDAVQKALYKEADINFSPLRTHDTFAAVSSLIMASKRGSA